MKKILYSATQQQYMDTYRTYLLMRNYAPTTIKSYVNALYQYWRFCVEYAQQHSDFEKDKAPYLWFKHVTQTYGAGTVFSQSFSALKLFYVHILKRDWAAFALQRPRRVRFMPELMSVADVTALLAQCSEKYQTIFLTFYATGMRMSELCNLKMQDINAQNGTIRVRQGKGRKDRLLPAKEPLMMVLDQYRAAFNPSVYLFNGAKNGHPLGARSIQHAFQTAKNKAKLNPKITPHSLRHAFATHHIEGGPFPFP